MRRLLAPALVLLLAPLVMAGSCSNRISVREFHTHAWSTACDVDADCVLVSAPCDHCQSGGVAVRASERQGYVDLRYRVSCDDHDYGDECGDALDRRAVCEQGTCASVLAE